MGRPIKYFTTEERTESTQTYQKNYQKEYRKKMKETITNEQKELIKYLKTKVISKEIIDHISNLLG